MLLSQYTILNLKYIFNIILHELLHRVTKYITCLWIKVTLHMVSKQNTPHISAGTCKQRKLPAFGVILWMCIHCQMFCGHHDVASASEYLQEQRNSTALYML